jgi:hypothetical protein
MIGDASSRKPFEMTETGDFWKASKIAIVATIEVGEFGDKCRGFRYNHNPMIGRRPLLITMSALGKIRLASEVYRSGLWFVRPLKTSPQRVNMPHTALSCTPAGDQSQCGHLVTRLQIGNMNNRNTLY